MPRVSQGCLGQYLELPRSTRSASILFKCYPRGTPKDPKGICRILSGFHFIGIKHDIKAWICMCFSRNRVKMNEICSQRADLRLSVHRLQLLGRQRLWSRSRRPSQQRVHERSCQFHPILSKFLRNAAKGGGHVDPIEWVSMWRGVKSTKCHPYRMNSWLTAQELVKNRQHPDICPGYPRDA